MISDYLPCIVGNEFVVIKVPVQDDVIMSITIAWNRTYHILHLNDIAWTEYMIVYHSLH